MGVVTVLDGYYLAITILITVVYQLIFFSIAYSLKFDKVTDFAGGTNFVVLALVTLGLSGFHHVRQLVLSLFITIWGLRLSCFLLFRIIKTGKDDRFDDKRDKFFPFLGFWIFQMLWVWTVSLPVTVSNSPNVIQLPQPAFGTGRDIAGTIIFLIGLVIESISDAQKFYFKMQTSDKVAICDKGLFSWSRHPNYFGEIILQFAIYMIAVSPTADGDVSGQESKVLYATVVGPLLTTILLLFVSGMNLSERSGAKRRYIDNSNWVEYTRYLNRTSIIIPFPPSIYAKIPKILKKILFLELPIYEFDPSKNIGLPSGEDEV